MVPTIPLQAGAVGLLGLVFFALFLYMVFWVYTDAQNTMYRNSAKKTRPSNPTAPA